ncbi:MAG: S8 family serine peptidase [Flavobacteriales bacterium]|nr:S8 family serine peptidase [Flavobacteriales bacterium]
MEKSKCLLGSLGTALVVASVLAFATGAHGQTAPDTYWVAFTDKSSTPYSLSQPEAFLSARAIQRRAAQNIAYDELDLPVDPAYVAAVEGLPGVAVLNRSKWFNGVTVRVESGDALAAVQALPFVATVNVSGGGESLRPTPDKFRAPLAATARDVDEALYGSSFLQISMLNGQALHGIGAQGQGMLIGVLDSGFEGVDVSMAFEAVRQRGGIVATRDLVTHDGDVYADHWHGRAVLSCMAARLDSQLIGTAPEADYVLLRTEEVATEYPVEEDHWIAGAELADSLGCDVLNTSLGYTTFDDSTMDHTYEQLDGLTLRISIAANIASSKGMVPVNSAGNSGSSSWFYISAPADAIDVLTVGAVGDVENHAPFSSHGPSADGRVKPDVCAMGWGTRVLNVGQDSAVAANGTSFASPVLAGLVACLWQLHPGRTATEIMDAVRRSASLFSDPNDSLGYGIPDFGAAHAWLTMTIGIDEPVTSQALVFPSPFVDHFTIRSAELRPAPTHVLLFDAEGRVVLFTRSNAVDCGLLRVDDQRLVGLPPGTYLLVVEQGGVVVQQHIVRAP